MTQAQEQKLDTYLMFRDSFKIDSLNEEAQSSLKPHFEKFLYYLNLILKARQMMAECGKISEDYVSVRNEIIQSTLLISRKVTAFALLEEMIETQGTFCFIYTELMNEPDTKLLSQCKSLLHFITASQNDLIDYGIDMAFILSYRNLIDHFQLLVESNTMDKDLGYLHENQFAEMFNKAEEIFENQFINIHQLLVVRTL